MATNTAVVAHVSDPGAKDVWMATWTALGNADTGTGVTMSGASDRCIQVSGTWGSATLTVKGSNDNVTWIVLTDPQGNNLTKTADFIEQISELTRYIRVETSGGSGTALNANLLLKGQRV